MIRNEKKPDHLLKTGIDDQTEKVVPPFTFPFLQRAVLPLCLLPLRFPPMIRKLESRHKGRHLLLRQVLPDRLQAVKRRPYRQ